MIRPIRRSHPSDEPLRTSDVPYIRSRKQSLQLAFIVHSDGIMRGEIAQHTGASDEHVQSAWQCPGHAVASDPSHGSDPSLVLLPQVAATGGHALGSAGQATESHFFRSTFFPSLPSLATTSEPPELLYGMPIDYRKLASDSWLPTGLVKSVFEMHAGRCNAGSTPAHSPKPPTGRILPLRASVPTGG
jgi:hypothetical protein